MVLPVYHHAHDSENFWWCKGSKTLPLPILGFQLGLLFLKKKKKNQQEEISLLTCTAHFTLKQKVTQSCGPRLWLVEHLQQRPIHLQRNDRTKESNFRLPRAADCGKVNKRAGTNGGSLVCRFLSCHLWSDEILSPVLEFIFCFQAKRGRAGGWIFLCLLFLNCLQLEIIYLCQRGVSGVTYSYFLQWIRGLYLPPPGSFWKGQIMNFGVPKS